MPRRPSSSLAEDTGDGGEARATRGAGRLAEHLVAGTLHGIERCAPAADVAGDRQPLPAAERGDEREAAVEEFAGALDLERHQFAEGRIGGAADEIVLGDAEPTQ